MKLVVAIVNNDDSHAVLSEITRAEFSATKLSTSGGFLRAGNVTLLIGVEDERVSELIDLIGRFSRKRTQLVQPASTYINEPLMSAPRRNHGRRCNGFLCWMWRSFISCKARERYEVWFFSRKPAGLQADCTAWRRAGSRMLSSSRAAQRRSAKPWPA